MLFRTWLTDLRLTLRHAGRSKAFYASAVLTLAMGIAGATVMFTLVRGILLRPLQVPVRIKQSTSDTALLIRCSRAHRKEWPLSRRSANHVFVMRARCSRSGVRALRRHSA